MTNFLAERVVMCIVVQMLIQVVVLCARRNWRTTINHNPNPNPTAYNPNIHSSKCRDATTSCMCRCKWEDSKVVEAIGIRTASSHVLSQSRWEVSLEARKLSPSRGVRIEKWSRDAESRPHSQFRIKPAILRTQRWLG
jgi:hypothetical protein